MKIVIVGYQGSGRSSLFHWLTGEVPDPSLSHSLQLAMATIPEPRIDELCGVYQPKKITRATLQIIDTPGLSRDSSGNAPKLADLREAGCLVLVASGFGGHDPARDLASLDDDLLIADLSIVNGRVEKLRESVTKPRPDREQQIKELELLEPIHGALESGKAVRDIELSTEQEQIVRSFGLLTQKPRLVIINSDNEQSLDVTELEQQLPDNASLVVVNVAMELELEQMDPAERDEFCQEMEIERFDRDQLVRQLMDVSRQMLFFTAGDKEVRSWIITRGTTAVEAAGQIHTDMARGFIRAETMNCDDLVRLGSERELKAQNLLRREPRDYVIQEGDVIFVQHN